MLAIISTYEVRSSIDAKWNTEIPREKLESSFTMTLKSRIALNVEA